MRIVQKVHVYSDFVGEEVCGLAVFYPESIPPLVDYYKSAVLIADIKPRPDCVKFIDITPVFYKCPNFYDLEETNPDIFNDLENGKCVFLDDLAIFGIEEDIRYTADVECCRLRIYVSDPDDFMWTGYIGKVGANVPIETAGFSLLDVLKELHARVKGDK